MHGSVWLLVLVLAAGSAWPASAAAGNSISFEGKVIDAAGISVGGATVVVEVWDPPRTSRDANRRPARHSTAAGANGAFRLVVPISSGDWEAALLALKAGHGPGGQEIRSPGQTRGLTLSLTRPGFVAGKVVDRAGRAIPGAVVGVVWSTSPGREGSLRFEGAGPTARTDAQGHFRLGPLPAGSGLQLFADH